VVFWRGGKLPNGPQNLVQTIVSKTSSSSYIVCFNFLRSAVKKFILEGAVLGIHLLKDPQIGPNNCLTNNFLHYEFQFFMLSSSNIHSRRAIWGGRTGFTPSKRTLSLVQTIVSQTTSYFMNFNLFSSSKVSLWEGHFRGWGFALTSPQRELLNLVQAKYI